MNTNNNLKTISTTVYLLLSFIIAVQCNAQKIGKSDGDKFITWMASNITERSISQKPAKLDVGMTSNLSEVGLTYQDSISFAKQIEKSQTIFAKDLFPGKILLSDDEEKVQLRNVAHLLVRLSRPIFFGNNVWIYIEHFCGNNCGSGEFRSIRFISPAIHCYLQNKFG